MTTCALVLGIITCTIAPGTRLTPAEAAAILAPRQFVYVPAWPSAPLIVVARSGPMSGPFGEFKELSPARRLDGSLRTDPPWSMTTYVGWQRYSQRNSGCGMRADARLLLPRGQPGSITTRTIRSPQPERRTTSATASSAFFASLPDRQRPPTGLPIKAGGRGPDASVRMPPNWKR